MSSSAHSSWQMGARLKCGEFASALRVSRGDQVTASDAQMDFHNYGQGPNAPMTHYSVVPNLMQANMYIFG